MVRQSTSKAFLPPSAVGFTLGCCGLATVFTDGCIRESHRRHHGLGLRVKLQSHFDNACRLTRQCLRFWMLAVVQTFPGASWGEQDKWSQRYRTRYCPHPPVQPSNSPSSLLLEVGLHSGFWDRAEGPKTGGRASCMKSLICLGPCMVTNFQLHCNFRCFLTK